MNLLKDLGFAFKLLPRRLPRIVITSIFVAAFFFPALFLALAADSIYNIYKSDASAPHLALLTGEVGDAASADTLASYRGTITGSAQVLNGLPFLAEKYLPNSSTDSLTSSTEPTLLSGETLDATLPVYGTFDRVVTPAYAAYLASLTEPSFSAYLNNAANVSGFPSLESLRSEISAVIGKTFTERYSIVLSADAPVLESDLTAEPTSPELATDCLGGPEDTDCLEPELETQTAAETNCAGGPDGANCAEAVTEKPGEITTEPEAELVTTEKTVDFYVTYRVSGIATIYNRPDLNTLALVGALAKAGIAPTSTTRITSDQASLDRELARGFFVSTAALTLATSELTETGDLITPASSVSAAESAFRAAALRTEDYPLVSFASASDLLHFWRKETTALRTPDLLSSSDFRLGELNSTSLSAWIVNNLIVAILVLYSLVAGLLTFLLFNSAKKSLVRRNAQTFALLHAVRATDTDTRLVCLPFRVLLLLCPAGLLALALYFLAPSFLTIINSVILPTLSLIFFSPAVTTTLTFGLCSKILIGLYILFWLLSGLRTRSFSSMSRVSKYIEN